ncbi:unnamed protein product [Vitrella brassicaformis CCMP3155]|uniref:NAD(P)-binding domain-containing protein n=2 Tax=Vitrella brassicaformis TaxID=1169539 RepID=A0A0G4GQN1_VITBC|nr:unnamed protein product [Vitrella brassicaformis CCMP3155]|eukprot:CEM32565.1 unnamed protein product [Vitrella brassicaformis CCMP3155]
MKVLLTGGAGFVGGHTCEVLLKRGDEVVLLDNVNDYYDQRLKEHTLDILRSVPTGKLTEYLIDLRDLDAVTKVFEEHKFDVICHLAAQAGVRHSIQHAISNVQTNILATVHLLELSRKHNVPNFVMASSSSVYGKSSTPPFSEDQLCNKPISPYAATKRSCELFAHTYHHLYNQNVTCLRFFTVYGPRGRPDMAAYKFIDRIYHDRAIDKYGDGSAIREFTYISDIVDGVIAAIDNPRPYEIVNLGGGATHTLNELISTIEKHCGKKALINQMPDQPGDVPLTSADQKRAQAILNFHPKVSLDDGIRQTVHWYLMYQKLNKGLTNGV